MDDRITWAIIWKKKAKSYQWLAHEYMALYDIQFAKVGRARAWSAAWKSSARANRRIARARMELADYRWELVVSYIDLLSRKITWARTWKKAAKMFRSLARRYIREYTATEVLFWNLVEQLSVKGDWAAIWKETAKAYRAMSLSQRDAPDRHMQWIDPGVELPEAYQTVAILRVNPSPYIVLAHRVDGNHWHQHGEPDWLTLESECVIGWHPLPELPDA